jgi:hypothetical protein
MYKCEVCGVNSKRREGCNVVPISFRPKTYNIIEDIEISDDRAPLGYEIVKEKRMCAVCRDKWIGTERPALPPTRKREVVAAKKDRRRSRGREESPEDGENRYENRRRFEKERF